MEVFSIHRINFYKGRHRMRVCKLLIKEECKQHSFVRMEYLQNVVEDYWDGQKKLVNGLECQVE